MESSKSGAWPNANGVGNALLFGPDPGLDREVRTHHPVVLGKEGGFRVGPLKWLTRREADGFENCTGRVQDVDRVIVDLPMLGRATDSRAKLQIVNSEPVTREGKRLTPIQPRGISRLLTEIVPLILLPESDSYPEYPEARLQRESSLP